MKIETCDFRQSNTENHVKVKVSPLTCQAGTEGR